MLSSRPYACSAASGLRQSGMTDLRPTATAGNKDLFVRMLFHFIPYDIRILAGRLSDLDIPVKSCSFLCVSVTQWRPSLLALRCGSRLLLGEQHFGLLVPDAVGEIPG